jgi:site-specific recombinase XerD
MTQDPRATHLAAVPDPQPLDHGDLPADWPDLRRSFVLSLRATRRSPRTVETYLQGCDAFARFLHEHEPGRLVEQASKDDLRAFLVDLQDRGRKPGTVATRHRALRALFRFATEEGVITTNPMATIPQPAISEERVPPALEPEQVDAMVNACRPKSTFIGARDRALLLLIASSGIRSGECLGLTEDDLVLDSATPYVRVRHAKGDRYREPAISLAAAKAIDGYLRQRRKHPAAHRRELWLSRAHHALTSSGLLQLVHDAGERVDLDVHVHALRHAAVHSMLARQMAEGDVMVQAGWTNPKMLGRYGRAKATERSRAAFFREG